MGSPAKSPSIAPLLAVTILTSMCICPTGTAMSSELSASTLLQPKEAGQNRQPDDVSSSADTVAEARWARLPDDFVLGEGGQIVPRRQAPELIGVPVPKAVGLEPDDNHFDSAVLSGMPECGPSPATPAEITRLVIEASQRHYVDAGFAVAVVTAESRLDLVAAAYNAGEGRVREYGGIPPFKETIGYVAEVLNIQMGLEGGGAAASQQGDVADGQRSNNPASGIIATHERRQWVGGVMHF